MEGDWKKLRSRVPFLMFGKWKKRIFTCIASNLGTTWESSRNQDWYDTIYDVRYYQKPASTLDHNTNCGIHNTASSRWTC